jgi:hypothetical protein
MLVPTLRLTNHLKVKRPHLIMIAVCLFSFLINYPYIYLIATPASTVLVNYEPNGQTETLTFYTAAKSSWSFWATSGYFLSIHARDFHFQARCYIRVRDFSKYHIARFVSTPLDEPSEANRTQS